MPETDHDDDVAMASAGADSGAAAESRIDLPGIAWKRVSPKYLVAGLVQLGIAAVVVCGLIAVAWLAWEWTWAGWALPVAIVFFLISIIVEPRRVRSIGYALRADDLVFRRGIMFQRFVAVPYGRMQLVDITRGPVSRALGLADLRFVTAAASTAVAIPGLPEADAEELRDQLVTLAESRRAGL
ncbi:MULTISPECIES: PH domain-containing protein [unclassified Leifsonia]|uniref:PH domain-containing protein n=1 Tax=unclassified Leifsonia TaxID=2663824 RepID=UPI0012F8F406|nr:MULTISPECIES: PH domain-containing protein [unclassified Leifsonia]